MGDSRRIGLAYSVEVAVDGAPALAQFRREIAETRAAWAELRKTLAQPLQVKTARTALDEEEQRLRIEERRGRIASRNAAESERADKAAERSAESRAKVDLTRARTVAVADRAAAQASAAVARQKVADARAVAQQAVATARIQIAQARALAAVQATEAKNRAATARQAAADAAVAARARVADARAVAQAAAAQAAGAARAAAAQARLTAQNTAAQSRLVAQQARATAQQQVDEARVAQVRASGAAKAAAAQARLTAQQTKASAALAAQQAKAASQQASRTAALAAQQAKANVQQQILTSRLAVQNAKAAASIANANARNANNAVKSLKDAESSGSRLLFTFRRLFGVLAAFQLARIFVGGLKGAIVESIRFNSRIQDAVLGVQTLLTATGTLATATGKIATGPEKFALAAREARRQVALLRVDGLRTAATFEQLLEAFQSALAPGLRAGLKPDEVRSFAVKIAQAAAAIGIPQNQLAEEVRSILSGTIQARTTRIAVALGITNEDIRRAKEAGNLADFLFQKFSAFDTAGEKSLSNFSVIIANLRDATSQLLGEGGSEFFNRISSGLESILGALKTESVDGIGINPDALALVNQFFGVLTAALDVGARIGRALSLKDAAAGAAFIVSALRLILNLAGAASEGFARGFVVAGKIAQSLVGFVDGFLGGLKDLPLASIEGIATALGTIIGLTLGFKTTVFALTAPISLISKGFGFLGSTIVKIIPGLTKLKDLIKQSAVLSALLNGPFLALLAVVGLIVAAFTNDFIRSIKVGELTVGALVDLFKVDLRLAIERVALFFQSAWVRVAAVVQNAFRRVFQFFANVGIEIAKGVLKVIALVSDDAEKKLKQLEGLQDALNASVNALNDAETKAADRRINAIDQEIDAAKRLAEQRRREIREASKSAPSRSIGEAIQEALNSGLALLGVTDEEAKKVDTVTAKAKTLRSVFADFPVIVGQTREALEQQGDTLKKLLEDVKEAEAQLSLTEALQGAGGVGRSTLEILSKGAEEVRKTTKELEVQIAQARTALRGLSEEEKNLRVQLEAVGGVQFEQLEAISAAGARLSELENQRAAAQQRIAALERQRNEATKAGAAERAKALDEEIQNQRTLEAGFTETLQKVEAGSDAFVKGLDLSADAVDTVLQLAKKLAEIRARQSVTEQGLGDAQADVGRVQQEVLSKTVALLRAAVVEERERLRLSALKVRADLDAARLQNSVLGLPETGEQNNARRRLVDVQARLILEQAATKELELQAEAEIAALRASLERVKGTKAEGPLRELIAEKAGDLADKLETAKEEQRALNFEAQRQIEILEHPVDAGFARALEEFKAQAEDTFSFVKDLSLETFNGIAGTLSDSLLAALDPSQGSILEKWQDLAQRITKIILDEFFKLAILRAILEPLGLTGTANPAVAAAAAATAVGAATSAAASAAAAAAAAALAAEIAAEAAAASIGGAIGAWGGGLIGPGPHGVPGLGHLSAPQGLAQGGTPQPKGLHPSDRIPIWAALGEFMQPVRAVQRYGVGFMEAIRRGEIDPLAARALVGVRAASASISAAPRIGFNTGGAVTGKAGAQHGATGNLKIVNVTTREDLLRELASEEGQEIIVNAVRARTRRN